MPRAEFKKRFEALPPIHSVAMDACAMCGGVAFWRGIHGGRSCRVCHPPAASWLETTKP